MSDNANQTIEVAEEAIVTIQSGLASVSINDKEDRSPRRRPRLPTAERIRLWEEEQKTKVVLAKGIKGTVKWYSVLGRYGFISREDGEKDVFVHQTAITASETNKFYLRTLGNGEAVEFDLVEGKKGPEAGNVTGPEGGNVMGSKFRHILLSRFRRNQRSRANRNNETEADISEAKSVEESKKPKKQRKQRPRKSRTPKSATKADESTEEVVAGTRREKIIDEDSKQTKLDDRCGSALGEAHLGAQAIDAQI